MAKADDTSSTIDWIWLFDALQEAKEVLGSEALAKALLKEWLSTGQLPWTCTLFVELDEQGLVKAREHEPSLGNLLAALIWFSAPSLWINWRDNSAGDIRNCALGIKVPLEQLRALLRPEEPREREEVQEAKSAEWIAADAKKMKAENKIPPDIRISKFARDLEGRMRKAAERNKSLRPIGWRSIKNRLPEWGLWPVTSIK
jgi:hypothetical protein